VAKRATLAGDWRLTFVDSRYSATRGISNHRGMRINWRPVDSLSASAARPYRARRVVSDACGVADEQIWPAPSGCPIRRRPTWR
jgi:hypothetical protein